MFSFMFLISTLALTAVLLVAFLANEIADFLELRRKNQELKNKGLLPRHTIYKPAKNVRFTLIQTEEREK